MSPDYKRKLTEWAVRIAIGLVVGNFLTFMAMSTYFGGDAFNGYAQAGHYFVCAHGSCREVSLSVWRFSYWHGVTAICGLFLFVFGGALHQNWKHIW